MDDLKSRDRRDARRLRVRHWHRHHLDGRVRRAVRRHLHGDRARHFREAEHPAWLIVRQGGHDRHPCGIVDRRRRHAGRQLDQHPRHLPD